MGSLLRKVSHPSPRARMRGLMGFAAFMLTTMVTLPGSPTQAAINPFFTMRQTASNDISAFTKWTSVMPRYVVERASTDTQCEGEACLSAQWEALLDSLRGRPMKAQLAAINDFFNAVPYIADEENYGVTDYWATPYELMAHGGDCEDFAIAKYISLRRLGVPQQDLRILVVRDQERGNIIHAVLEVTLPSGAHILDNQEPRVLRAAQAHHYAPVFAINETRWWSFKR